MANRGSRLISLYEQCLLWLRSPGRQRFGGSGSRFNPSPKNQPI